MWCGTVLRFLFLPVSPKTLSTLAWAWELSKSRQSWQPRRRRKKYCPRHGTPSPPPALVIRLSCNWAWQASSVNHSPHCPFLFLSPLASLPLSTAWLSPSARWRYFFVVANICRATAQSQLATSGSRSTERASFENDDDFVRMNRAATVVVLSGAAGEASLAAKGAGEIGKWGPLFFSNPSPSPSSIVPRKSTRMLPSRHMATPKARIDSLPPLISKWKPRYLRGAGASL